MLTEKTVGRSEDGEFELILGNRQLLSVFFIVVVLLGVFFTMGYIVGKNAVTGTELATRKADPIVVDPSKPSSFGSEPKSSSSVKPGDLGELPSSTTPSTVAPLPTDTPKARSREEEAREARKLEAERKEAERKAEIERKAEAKRRAEDERKAEAERRETERKAEIERRAEAKKAEAKKTEAKKEARKETKEAAPARAAVSSAPTPQAGQQFLQVVASSKPDCEIIADVLRRKGFSAAVVAGPSEKVFRVVVGPLADAGSITRTRNDLEAAGFQKPVLKKF